MEVVGNGDGKGADKSRALGKAKDTAISKNFAQARADP